MYAIQIIETNIDDNDTTRMMLTEVHNQYHMAAISADSYRAYRCGMVKNMNDYKQTTYGCEYFTDTCKMAIQVKVFKLSNPNE
jgi:hypothetical protein